jgi:hypothetical protein
MTTSRCHFDRSSDMVLAFSSFRLRILVKDDGIRIFIERIQMSTDPQLICDLFGSVYR